MKHIDFYLDAIQKKNASGGGTGGITPTGTKEISIVANGERNEDVTQYANAHIVVDVPVPDEPSGTMQITKNGIHDVKNFASANVQVPVPAEPSGSKVIEITENGNTKHDVKQFAEADVRVNVPSEGITPTGVKTITANGTHDVTEFAQAKVNVPIPAEPAGTKSITENGVHDIKAFANVNVQVPVGVTPQGTKTINVTENGEKTEDVSSFKNVHIVTNVPSSGGGVPQEKYDSILNVINGTVTNPNFVNEDMKKIPDYFFQNDIKIVSYSFPNVKTVGKYAFAYEGFSAQNTKVTEIHLPSATTILEGAFSECYRLETLEIPNVETIYGPNTFDNSKLKKLIVPKLKTYNLKTFKNSKKPTTELVDMYGGTMSLDLSEVTYLKTLVLRKSDAVVPLGELSSGIQNIYVPDSLVEQYKKSTNWVTHADKIKPLSTYVEV